MFAWRAAYFLTAILVTSNSGTLASATQVSPLDVPHVFLRPLVFENVVAFESSPMPYFSLCAVQNNHLHNLLLLFEIMMFFKDRSLALITLSLCWIAITPSSVYAADSDPTGFGEMFSMNCGLLTRVRQDPITNPGSKTSGHVHAISGSQGFSPEIDKQAEDLLDADCTSCGIVEDMSVYWTANGYFVFKNGSFAEVNQEDPNSGLRVYYFARLGDEDGTKTWPNGTTIPQNTPKAFPPGLRMLAGHPSLGSYSDDPRQQAVTYSCYGHEDSAEGKLHAWPVDVQCDEFIRAEIYFPYCWNGQDLDSDDHFAHMAYGVSPRGSDEKVDVGTSGGVCPPSHPIRTPSLFYERFFHVELWFEMLDQALNESQPFVFSHGDGTGYGFHGDFISGWPQETLQSAIDQCGAAVMVEACSVLTVNEAKDECKLKPAVDEITGGLGVVLDELPGGHALRWDGPSLLDIEAESDSATPSTDGSSSTNNSKSESAPNASVTAGSDPERGESNSVHSLNQSGSASATAAVDLDQDSGAEAVVLGSWTTHSLLGLTSVVVVRSWSV